MTKTPARTSNNRKLTTQQELLIRNLFTAPNIKEAAKQAGYSDKTASSSIYTMVKKQFFKDKLLQYATDNNLLNIPILAQIEKKIYKSVLADPTKYPRYKDVFKQTKQIAGILGQDVVPATTIINIKHIDQVQVAMNDIAQKRLDSQL